MSIPVELVGTITALAVVIIERGFKLVFVL
jgi:hypothetical protein